MAAREYEFYLRVLKVSLMSERSDQVSSPRSRRLEVAGERGNGRARGRHARGEGTPSSPLACLLLARPFFLVPTTCKRLLRRLPSERYLQHEEVKFVSPSGHVMFCLFYRY